MEGEDVKKVNRNRNLIIFQYVAKRKHTHVHTYA